MKEQHFFEIFKDDNDWNEKSIIGFIAFTVMIFVLIADLGTDIFGISWEAPEFIYNSFLILVLGCFGIGSIEKVFGKGKNKNKVNDTNTDPTAGQ